MAIMRSTIKSGGGDWLGIKTGKLTKVTSDADKYSWADIYLLCEFTVEGSDYPRVLKIAGSWEKNSDGTITDCALLRRITYLFDAIGEQGGVNQHGDWVDANEHKIDDIVSHLETKYGGSECTVYVYRELAKDGKAYTRIHNKVLKVGNGSEKELQSYIDFMKTKGYIKEAPADHDNKAVNPGSANVDASGIDIANL